MTDVRHADHRVTLRANMAKGPDEIVGISRVDLEAPWRWLSAGWADLLAMPHISLTYGAVFAVVAVGLWFGLGTIGWQSLILALAGGFMLIGPVLAVGLYEASRRREMGEPVTLSSVFLAAFKSPDQLALLGFALLLVFMVWVQIAFLLFMMFFGDQPFPPIDEFVPRLLFTWQGVTLLCIGTAIGACLASVVFAISAISAPMMIARPYGVTSAIFASIQATKLNIRPMALWAVLIVGFVAVGLATLCAGLVVIFPLIGHASWHAYRELLDQDGR